MREVDERYAAINKAREEIEAIREKCSHESWREGLHVDEYLPTNTRYGAICNVCDKFLWRTPRVDKPVICDYADDFDFDFGSSAESSTTIEYHEVQKVRDGEKKNHV